MTLPHMPKGCELLALMSELFDIFIIHHEDNNRTHGSREQREGQPDLRGASSIQ